MILNQRQVWVAPAELQNVCSLGTVAITGRKRGEPDRYQVGAISPYVSNCTEIWRDFAWRLAAVRMGAYYTPAGVGAAGTGSFGPIRYQIA